MTKAYEWVNQGKYNLTPEEFKREQERIRNDIKKEYEDLYSLLRQDKNFHFVLAHYRTKCLTNGKLMI